MLLLACVLLAVCPGGWAMDLTISGNPPLPAPNLAQDGAMERGAGKTPGFWRFGTAIPDNFRTAWVDGGRSGKCLYLKANSAIMSGYWNQGVVVEPETEYVCTGWFRLVGGRLLAYVNSAIPGGQRLDERFLAASMMDHFLVPVFLKPEFMAGGAPDTWQPFRVPFKTLPEMKAVSVSLGMYFQPGEVWYDDIQVIAAKTDLAVVVAAPEGLARVRLLARGQEAPLLDSDPLPAGTRDYAQVLRGASALEQYVLEATAADGKVQTAAYPLEVTP